MYCSSCGNKLNGSEKFCGKCGQTQKQSNSASKNDKAPKMLGSYGYGVYFAFHLFYSCTFYSIMLNLLKIGFKEMNGYSQIHVSPWENLFINGVIPIFHFFGTILLLALGGLLINDIRKKAYKKYGSAGPKLGISILISIPVNILITIIVMVLSKFISYNYLYLYLSIFFLLLVNISAILIQLIRFNIFKQKQKN